MISIWNPILNYEIQGLTIPPNPGGISSTWKVALQESVLYFNDGVLKCAKLVGGKAERTAKQSLIILTWDCLRRVAHLDNHHLVMISQILSCTHCLHNVAVNQVMIITTVDDPH